MATNPLLVSFALPWEETLEPSQMVWIPHDTRLSEIPSFQEPKDFVLVDQHGKVIGWLPFSLLMDTIIKQWKTTEAYYETLLQAVNDAITVVDREGQIISWNPKSEEMYNQSSKEMLGKPVMEYFREEAVVLMTTLKEGKGVTRKYNQPHPGVHVLINTLPVRVNDEIIGGVSVERDISDIVKLNEELYSTTAYLQDLESQIDTSFDPFHRLKGRSTALRSAIDLSQKVSVTDATVLITGESGVGKELFAQAIHKGSKRADRPFVAINCGAIPASLFESELFGYESGAFTGAIKEGKKGKMDAASGGTLFLDEIGEMPLDLQVKLLRVLQEREFYRVGGHKPIPLDTRIVAATHRDLGELIIEGLFRQDLYYRLNVVSIFVPPLRERIEDIPELVQLYLKEFSIKYMRPIPKIDPEVMYTLMHHPWPGNIRELRNTIERLVILVDEETVKLPHLPKDFSKVEQHVVSLSRPVQSNLVQGDSDVSRLKYALQTTYGNKTAAAKMLGWSRVTLYNKMKKYGLE